MDSLDHHPPDRMADHDFSAFAFPPNGHEDIQLQHPWKLENEPSPYDHSTDHQNITSSRPEALHQPRSYGNEVQPAYARNGSSGSSDKASPHNRSNSLGSEHGLNDEFGMNNGLDGDLGRRQKGEGDESIPAWGELKTKAGKERKRLPLACITCRRKKVKCSGLKPSCAHCLRARTPCVYKTTTRKAAPRTDYMAMLDKRLKRMEDRIIKIIPKKEQDGSRLSITRAMVKPALPGTIPTRHTSTTKKRDAGEAFGPEVQNWSKTAPSVDIGSDRPTGAKSKRESLRVQEAEENKLLLEGAEALPSKDIQIQLAEDFFGNLYGQTYYLLHKPSFMEKLRAGNVPPVLILAVCAVAARYSTHPKINTTPEFARGEEWARPAREIVIKRYDWPNITILTCMLILGLHEFGTCQGGRSWALGGMAVRMSYALQLHRDLEHDNTKPGSPALSFVDREIRRRIMWACFLMDRFNSSGTERPSIIRDHTLRIQLPIKEKNFQLNIPGPTEDLRGEIPHPVEHGLGQLSDARNNMGVAAYTVLAIALWGNIIDYLSQGGLERDPHRMWLPESGYAKLVAQADELCARLPDDMKYSSENLQAHKAELLDAQFLFLHLAIRQCILFMNAFSVSAPMQMQQHQQDAPREFITKARQTAFDAANRISELIRDGQSHQVLAPFTGYCAFTSATVQIIGVFSKNSVMEKTSKENLTTNIEYLTKMKKYWGVFHYMSESLRSQYKACADKDAGHSSGHALTDVFMYGDWFDAYPNGRGDEYEDSAGKVKKEKGEDAVLGQPTEYHTVKQFIDTTQPSQLPNGDASRPPKRKNRKSPPKPLDNIIMPRAAPHIMSPHTVSPHAMSMPPNAQMPTQAYNPLSPTTMFGPVQGQFYTHPNVHAQQPNTMPQQLFNPYGALDQQMVGGLDSWGMPSGSIGAFEPFPDGNSSWFLPFNNIEPPTEMTFGGNAEQDSFGFGAGYGGMGGPGP